MPAERPYGRIRDRAEDFAVEEIPAYAPSGEGQHVFVRLTKIGRTTLDTVRAVARALGCDAREAGFAGMKDKRAVTTQTISLQAPRGIDAKELASRACSLAVDGVTVLDAKPHGHKLKPGHLAGNRFTIHVRDVPCDRLDEVDRAVQQVAACGVPNAFGAQRFGRAGDNASKAMAWLRGEDRGPRDPRTKRLLWSSVQSSIFNAVLDARVADGTWTVPLAGDLLKLRSSGGLFLCSDVQTDQDRARRGELGPTGPLVGARMRSPEGEPAALERRIAAAILGADFDLTATRSLGEGTRRPLRLWVDDVRWDIVESNPGHSLACVRVYFVLPKGAYATTVLGALFDTHEHLHEDAGYEEVGSEER
jgi:tRNA pseudouridine13 synthase